MEIFFFFYKKDPVYHFKKFLSVLKMATTVYETETCAVTLSAHTYLLLTVCRFVFPCRLFFLLLVTCWVQLFFFSKSDQCKKWPYTRRACLLLLKVHNWLLSFYFSETVDGKSNIASWGTTLVKDTWAHIIWRVCRIVQRGTATLLDTWETVSKWLFWFLVAKIKSKDS